jgi:hypothetical protein
VSEHNIRNGKNILIHKLHLQRGLLLRKYHSLLAINMVRDSTAWYSNIENLIMKTNDNICIDISYCNAM